LVVVNQEASVSVPRVGATIRTTDRSIREAELMQDRGVQIAEVARLLHGAAPRWRR
jgi:hypothetical protein